MRGGQRCPYRNVPIMAGDAFRDKWVIRTSHMGARSPMERSCTVRTVRVGHIGWPFGTSPEGCWMKTRSMVLSLGLALASTAVAVGVTAVPATAAGPQLLYGWGDNSYGQLGRISDPIGVGAPAPVEDYADHVIQVS